MKVSIIIVYFAKWNHFEKCLLSIKNHKTKFPFEVIIVNNGSENIRSKVLSILPEAQYIKSKNKGYGAGNNCGFRHAKGEYLFILNPDTELTKNTIDVLVSYLDAHTNTSVVAPNLLHPDGRVYTLIGSRKLTPLTGLVAHSFLNKLFPKNHISVLYFMLDTSVHIKRRAFAVPGCAFMIKKHIFEKVGMFDEQMFLYYEESDLGKRLDNYGYETYILPKAQVIHNHSSENNRSLKKHNAQSRFYYFKKHYGIFWALIVESFCRFSKRKAIVLAIIFGIVLTLFLV